MESPSMKYFSDQGRGASCMRTPMEPQIRLIVESEAQLAKVREAVCGAMVHPGGRHGSQIRARRIPIP